MENNTEQEQIQLKDLIVLHRAEFPGQSDEVLESYLEDLEENVSLELKEMLKQDDYKDKMDVAITYTAMIVFLLLKKVLGGTDNFNLYIKEYLMSIRYDDDKIKKMRSYFLQVYSSKELVETLLGLTPEVSEEFVKEVQELNIKYKTLISHK